MFPRRDLTRERTIFGTELVVDRFSYFYHIENRLKSAIANHVRLARTSRCIALAIFNRGVNHEHTHRQHEREAEVARRRVLFFERSRDRSFLSFGSAARDGSLGSGAILGACGAISGRLERASAA